MQRHLQFQSIVTMNSRVRVSSSWFAKQELYRSCSTEGPIVIVNNSNDQLSFGGGGTNGAIVRFFYPDQSTRFCGLMNAGRQHRDNWHLHSGPLCKAGSKGNGDDVNLTPHPPGAIWYNSLPEKRRRGTNVTHIVHVVGPINDAIFSNGEDEVTARKRAARVVGEATKNILVLAESKLGARTIVMSGISAGIFARGSNKWKQAMYDTMRTTIREHCEETSSEESMEVVLVGEW